MSFSEQQPRRSEGESGAAGRVLHGRILDELLASEDRRSEEFQALRRYLAYSLSIVVAAIPKDGFLFLKELAGMGDAHVKWVCKQNLKKNRLSEVPPRGSSP
ncbi:MAG: hypothetical protein OK474_00215 [Thaumarchaeota archaeon]|nr:hypothetical protein [Nitrososphaerota archaeon]